MKNRKNWLYLDIFILFVLAVQIISVTYKPKFTIVECDSLKQKTSHYVSNVKESTQDNNQYAQKEYPTNTNSYNSTLNTLKLFGTATGTNKSKKPIAYIHNSDARHSKLYRLGETIRDAKIVKISKGEVILEQDGQIGILKIDKQNSNAYPETTIIRKSEAIPADLLKLAADASEFSLQNPLAALRKIKKIKASKDISKVKELIKAYDENAAREDGYGNLIQTIIVKTLAELKSRETSDFLIDKFKKTNDITLKDEMAYALGEMSEKKALEELYNYREHLFENEPKDALIKNQWQVYIDRVNEAIEKIDG